MKNFLTLLLTIAAAVVFAQKGTISGKVMDPKLKEPIIGASVVVLTNGQGTTTDFDGNYTLENVPVGEHQIEISYISFATKIVKATVVKNKNVEVNIDLAEDVKVIDAVEVTADRVTNTNAAVILELKKVDNIAVGVSENQIKMSQDRDAGQVIKRLAGVSIQNDRFVNIRGMAERYNVVLLNGIITPSSEIDVRAFSFDMLPSSAIDRMQVFKTASADMPGDFAGGVIKIFTKSQVEENKLSVGFSTGLRLGVTGVSTTQYQGGSLDWLGFDDGGRMLPASTPTLRALNTSATTASNFYKSLPAFYQVNQVRVLPDFRASLGYDFTFRVGRAKVSALNSVNYSNTHQLPFDALQRRYQGVNNDELIREWTDENYTQNARLGVLSNWAVKIKNTRIDFRNLFNQSGSSITQNQSGYDVAAANIDIRNQSFRYISKTIYSSQVNVNHKLGERANLNWVVGGGITARNEPDYRIITSTRDRGTEDEFMVNISPNVPSLNAASRFYSDLSEYSGIVRADYEVKLNKEILAEDESNMKLKVGAWGEIKDRLFSARWFGLTNPNSISLINMTPEQVFANDMVGNTNNTFRVSEGTNNDDYYAAQSYLGAGYASVFIPMGVFTANVGVRTEYNSIQLQSFTRGSYRAVNVDKQLFNVLPSLNVSYNINEKHKLRTAYSMTVNRPEFRELAPFSYFDFEERVSITGNTQLQAATVHNIDLRYEFYPSKDELITFSAFYKHFNNPIEREGRQSGNGINYSYGNPNSAKVYGIELDVRKTIPGILDNKLSAVLNASLIFSEVDASNRPGQLTNRSLQGQSPYLINFGLYYAGEKFKASMLYNSFGDRIFAIGDLNGNQSIYEIARHVIDLNLSYSIAKKVDLSLSAQDLLNQPFSWMSDANSDSKIDGKDLLFRQFRRGQLITLGINAKF